MQYMLAQAANLVYAHSGGILPLENHQESEIFQINESISYASLFRLVMKEHRL